MRCQGAVGAGLLQTSDGPLVLTGELLLGQAVALVVLGDGPADRSKDSRSVRHLSGQARHQISFTGPAKRDRSRERRSA